MLTIITSFDFLRYFIILFTDFVCAFIIYKKLSKTKIKASKLTIILLFMLFISYLSSCLRYLGFGGYRVLFFLSILIMLVLLNYKEYYYSIPLSFISLGISYGIEIICVVLSASIFYWIGFHDPTLISEILTSTFHICFSIIFVKVKRFSNGFLFLKDKSYFGIGLLISGPIIIVESLNKENYHFVAIAIFLFGILLTSIGLFIWIRSAFKRYYRKKLKKRAEEYSKIELAEKDKEIKRLLDENTSLSNIIHLDNHIIQSIEAELNKLNNSNLTDKLLISIHQRNEFINDTLVKSKNLSSTGSADIDAVLADLYIKAASRGIDYNLNVDGDINYLLNNLFSKDDFEILLRKTITNAIVSVENNPDTPGRIFINISQPNDIYELTIMDNGINKDDINLISEIIKESNASILTKNFDDNDSFTKSITIRFDGLKNNTAL